MVAQRQAYNDQKHPEIKNHREADSYIHQGLQCMIGGAIETFESTGELTGTIQQLQHEILTRQNVEKDLRHSRECLLLAVGAAEIGTCDCCPQTGRLDCSDETKRHFGISPHVPVSYDLFLAALHPDDQERIKTLITGMLLSGEDNGIFSLEFRTIGIEDGEERWISARGQVFYNAQGQAVRFIGVTRDISREKHSTQMILRLNRMHAALAATNQAIVHSDDQETIFREFCRVAIELGGFKLAFVGLIDNITGVISVTASHGATDYLVGLRLSSRTEPNGMGPAGISVREGSLYVCNDFQNDPVSLPWHERARLHGLCASASIPLRRNGTVIGILALYADEKDFFDSHQVELIQQMGADVSFALGVIENEQRRRQAEQTVREKEQMLIQQSRHAAMGEMLNNIAHQWRQPLNLLGLTTQQLLLLYDLGELNRDVLADSISKSMEVIQHMSTTIDDFRNYFRPNKEKVKFSGYEAVVRTLSLMEGSFSFKQIKITITAESNLPIYGYPNEFAQVLLNILNNACDAVMERSIRQPAITIAVFDEDGRSVITITDNAGGIPEDIIDKIFDPYFTTKGPQAGTGMGLFMSKSIIERNMGGRLTARNVAGGAEFRIEF